MQTDNPEQLIEFVLDQLHAEDRAAARERILKMPPQMFINLCLRAEATAQIKETVRRTVEGPERRRAGPVIAS